jgi:arylsulfatase A-like enzyme
MPSRDACRTWAKVPVDRSVARVDVGEADRRHLIDLYDAGVRQLDAELGRLFAFLRAERLLDDSLLVLTSDHGEEFLEHGGLLHSRTLYQEVLHVPLILRGPGIPAGARVAAPVSLVDVAPTVLAALGARPPEDLDGLDLSPLWRRDRETPAGDTPLEAALRSRALFAEASFGPTGGDLVRAVRRGRHKLHYRPATGETELYDLAGDAAERRDVSAEEPRVAAALREELLRRIADAPGEGRAELSPEDAERLRALGYLP